MNSQDIIDMKKLSMETVSCARCLGFGMITTDDMMKDVNCPDCIKGRTLKYPFLKRILDAIISR